MYVPDCIVPEDDGSPFGRLDKVMKGLERIISGLQDREQARICIYRKIHLWILLQSIALFYMINLTSDYWKIEFGHFVRMP